VSARHPVLVTTRLRAGLPSLRRERELALIRSRFEIAAERFCVRLIEYSVQSNHVHLIVETEDERSLAQAMKGLFVRIARGLNRLWRRSGAVLDDHYHARVEDAVRSAQRARLRPTKRAQARRSLARPRSLLIRSRVRRLEGTDRASRRRATQAARSRSHLALVDRLAKARSNRRR
jgi:REP element-mobilizing transposase RayT